MPFSRLACDPPLGQSTVIPHGEHQVKFLVLLETDEIGEADLCEVVLWHNCHEKGSWDGLNLELVQGAASSLAIARNSTPAVHRLYYCGIISRPSVISSTESIEFTFKYRKGSAAWTWANDVHHSTNGELIFQHSALPNELESCFSRFGSSGHVEAGQSEVSDAKLWNLTYEVPAAGKTSSFIDELVGVPTYVSRWFALAREWTPWLTPRHGKGVWKPDKDAILCSLLRRDGLHLVLLAVSGVDDILAVFKDDEFGGITLKARNEHENPRKARVIAAIGFNHEATLAACMYHARKVVQDLAEASSRVNKVTEYYNNNDIGVQWDAQWSDGLGYCTWNALGQNLTDKKILGALHTLEKSNIKIETLIIDDNWQTLDKPGAYQDDRGWMEFEANPQGFPEGLQKTISGIRDEHPSIKHVAVWHAMLGYWGGISPDGKIAQKYKTKEVRREDLGRVAPGNMLVVAEEHVQKMYDDFYNFLLSSGVDSVKTDAQFFLDLIGDPIDRRTLIRAYQDAWTISSLRFMNNRCISCMSQVPQIIFHSQLPTNKPTITLRNSDDFFPDEADSHPWHIFTNAYAALLTRHLNVLPDWDMFQTAHDFSAYHAAARCISGGPIYITDEPGKHNTELIRQMTATTTRGATTILRPSCVARVVPSSVYTSYSEPRLLKVASHHGRASTGAGLMGIFNVSKTSLTECIRLSEFPSLDPDREHVLRAFALDEVSEPIRSHTSTSTSTSEPHSAEAIPAFFSIHLAPREWEIVTAFPLEPVLGLGGRVMRVAPLGLLRQMSGAAAVLRYEVDAVKGTKMRVGVGIKALGVFGLYVDTLPSKTVDDDVLVMLAGAVVPRDTVSATGSVLRVDVEKAWAQMGLQPGWGNEVLVEVFVEW